MENCKMCKTEKDYMEILSNHWKLIVPPKPSSLQGYLILAPIIHKENWSELTLEEFSEYGKLIKKIDLTLKRLLPVERLYTVTISEEVRHLHIHLIPRLAESDLRGIDLIKFATQSTTRDFENREFYSVLLNELENEVNN